MSRILVLILALILSPLHSFRAEADCSVAPNEALLKHTVDTSGIEFSVAPANAGCPATKLRFSFVYLNQAANAWEEYSAWMTGSATGKAFNFKVPAINGKSKVLVAIEASNKWGIAAYTPYKASFQITAEEAAAKKGEMDLEAAVLAQERYWAAKKLTITCKKGKVSKKVAGDSPICPKGYINPMAGYGTFQAFSICQLYKVDSSIGGARLGDSGRTLTLDDVGRYEWSTLFLTRSDYECVARVLKMPDFVKTNVGNTRALDGMQRTTWGKITAYWTYHPDDGLNISFNSK